MAVGARWEDSNATGIGGDQDNDDAELSGAVYVFTRSGDGDWSQQAYVKASNTGAPDELGGGLALARDGDMMIVGAQDEASDAVDVGGDETSDAAQSSGAVYVFTRSEDDTWSQQAYVKASNTGDGDRFGIGLALSGDGDTLAAGADGEENAAAGRRSTVVALKHPAGHGPHQPELPVGPHPRIRGLDTA